MSAPLRDIAVNFLPLATEEFPLRLYRRRHQDGDRREAFEPARLRKLPQRPGDEDYQDYWVSTASFPGCDRFDTTSTVNHLVALDVLDDALYRRLLAVFGKDKIVRDVGILPRVAIVIASHREGQETIWLRPHFLPKTRELGFLLDYWVRARSKDAPNARLLQLSLTLDARGRRNRNFYVDRYEKIARFLKETLPKIFPLSIAGTPIAPEARLKSLPATRLSSNRLIFGNNRAANGAFGGVKQLGPLDSPQDLPYIYFLYRDSDRSFSRDLFRALRGDSFPTFTGMKEMFGARFDRTTVSGLTIQDYSESEINRALDSMRRNAAGRDFLPIVLVPFRRHDGDDSSAEIYYRLKHQMLTAGVASQFVSLAQLRNRVALKWSVSNIALQLFAKMGGQPWKVDTPEGNSLVVGLGQSTRTTATGVERYIAYSILTDSSGLYREMRILGSGEARRQADSRMNAASYSEDIAEGLRRIFRDYAGRYHRFVIHASFTVGSKELRGIQHAVEGGGEEREIAVLKFNAGNRYFGWDIGANSMVPYSGSVVHLGRREYLIWFAGVEPKRPKASRTDRAVHVRFLRPRDYAEEEARRELLEASFQLAKGNWRGFNARSLPVSVAYAHEVARFLRGFADAGLGEPAAFPSVPWFL